MGQHKEQLECAKEWYCLWNTKPTDPPAIQAIFALISSCMKNEAFADARLYASTVWEIINHKYDNKIPENQRQAYIGDGAYFLASATLRLSQTEGISAEEKHKAGQEAIALARRALEIHTQLYGTEHAKVANDMAVLAQILDYFNDDDDDEVLRLLEQATAISARVYGSLSSIVAVGEIKLGEAYYARTKKLLDARDFVHALAILELALSHYREAARIHRAINRMDLAHRSEQKVVHTEALRRATIATVASAQQLADAKAAAASGDEKHQNLSYMCPWDMGVIDGHMDLPCLPVSYHT